MTDKPSLDDLKIHRRPERETRIGAGVWIALLLILVVVALGYWWRTLPAVVEVHTVVAREIGGSAGGERTVLNASGYVTARRQATVSSKVTGKVVEVLFEEGMKVKEGQVLARLDDANVKAGLAVAAAQLQSSRAQVEETRAQLKQLDLEFQRAKELAGQHIASQADLDRAEAEAETTRARLARQQIDVEVAGRQMATWEQQKEDLVIRAPFAGIVTTKDAQPGEMISPNSAGGGFTRTGIGTIVDMDSLEIEIDVNESYINRVQPGQPVEATLDAYPEWRIPCKVVAIIPTADRQKSTVKVRVGFDKLDPRILPEMGVKVAFRETGDAALSRSVLIPKSAVRSEGGRDVIYVVKENRAERRAVTLGQSGDDEIDVKSGIAAGESVIVGVPAGLADGARVTVKN